MEHFFENTPDVSCFYLHILFSWCLQENLMVYNFDLWRCIKNNHKCLTLACLWSQLGEQRQQGLYKPRLFCRVKKKFSRYSKIIEVKLCRLFFTDNCKKKVHRSTQQQSSAHTDSLAIQRVVDVMCVRQSAYESCSS